MFVFLDLMKMDLTNELKKYNRLCLGNCSGSSAAEQWEVWCGGEDSTPHLSIPLHAEWLHAWLIL
jgi:hypothetical protein